VLRSGRSSRVPRASHLVCFGSRRGDAARAYLIDDRSDGCGCRAEIAQDLASDALPSSEAEQEQIRSDVTETAGISLAMGVTPRFGVGGLYSGLQTLAFPSIVGHPTKGVDYQSICAAC
jgi:hypothetical protein